MGNTRRRRSPARSSCGPPSLTLDLREPRVEPTNNFAERAIQPAMLWREGSFGTHSAHCSRFVERMLSVVASLKQQGRNALDFLTAALVSYLGGQQSP